MGSRSWRRLGAVASVAVGLWASSARAELTDKLGANYASQCQSEGVPLPPDWGSSDWIFNGTLSSNQTFINGEFFNYIYYYVSTGSPEGICVGNPRPDPDPNDSTKPGTNVQLFGVICQGSNGKVCFWDLNQNIGWNPSNGQQILSQTGVIASVDPSLIANPPLWVGGAQLSANNAVCSDCHAGENPFINHPGTATDIVTKLTATTKSFWFTGHWPDPIVRASDPGITVNGVSGGAWPTNPGPGTFPSPTNPALGPNDGSCLSCHVAGGPGGRFPELSSQLPSYCDVVLGQAKDKDPTDNPPSGAMPPFVPPPPVTFDAFWDAMMEDGGCSKPAPQGTIVMPPAKLMAPSPALVVSSEFPLSAN